MSHKQLSTVKLKAMTDELGESFAKAFATFLKEAAISDDTEVSRSELLAKLQSSEPLQLAGKEYAEQLHREYEMLEKAGKNLPPLKLEDISEPKPTLRGLAMQRGMTQKELAKKAKMDAAMVSRVLKNPNRSTLATIKRIAHALGVGLNDLNLDEAPSQLKAG